MTEQKPANPPAFPQLDVTSGKRDGHGDLIEPFTSASGGMTLRDYFAAAALTGLAASVGILKWDTEKMAKVCYRQADALLKARAE